jgi:hypothetical protein
LECAEVFEKLFGFLFPERNLNGFGGAGGRRGEADEVKGVSFGDPLPLATLSFLVVERYLLGDDDRPELPVCVSSDPPRDFHSPESTIWR